MYTVRSSIAANEAVYSTRRLVQTNFEGRDLARVLGSHTATFAKITSVPAEMAQSGEEPQLTTEVRTDLFSIAHNALANAFLHAQAGRVEVRLAFQADGTRWQGDGTTQTVPRLTVLDSRAAAANP